MYVSENPRQHARKSYVDYKLGFLSVLLKKTQTSIQLNNRGGDALFNSEFNSRTKPLVIVFADTSRTMEARAPGQHKLLLMRSRNSNIVRVLTVAINCVLSTFPPRRLVNKRES